MNTENKQEEKQCVIPVVMRSYVEEEINRVNNDMANYGWICKHFKRYYEGRLNSLENILLFIDTENYA
jgi:hypothetical protein